MVYLISNGYRLVTPYLYTKKVAVNWDGMKVSQVLLKYQPLLEKSVIEKAINEERVFCNGRPVNSSDDIVKQGEELRCITHMHEPEVLDTPVDILDESEDMVVINKPPSIPVYPVGKFRMNSIQKIVLSENPHLQHIYPIHRLDRLASGVLIFSCKKEMNPKISAQFSKRLMKKEYIARVKGTFPEGVVEVDKPISVFRNLQHIYCTVDPEGKPSVSIFERESVKADGSESLVRCKLITGRTHQIRVHLKWLGHPITNDYKYGGDLKRSQFNSPVPKIENYERVSWCHECIAGERETSHVAREDLLATCIWLHAMQYTSTNPSYKWTFKAPRPSWGYF